MTMPQLDPQKRRVVVKRASSPSGLSEVGMSASDVVFYGILSGLEAHRLVPGQRLVEADLALSFGVGRNSVREGLKRLAAEGVADASRHKGAAIRVLSDRETSDMLEVAQRLTGLLARMAARACATGARALQLKCAMTELRRAGASVETSAFGAARRKFYRALLDLAGSQELERLFRLIHMPIVYAQHKPEGLQSLRQHDYRAIAQAVIAGDEEAADLAAMAHVQRVRACILTTSAER